ncbi:hypothetical protein D9M68_608650 [compost metagenome]
MPVSGSNASARFTILPSYLFIKAFLKLVSCAGSRISRFSVIHLNSAGKEFANDGLIKGDLNLRCAIM